MSSVELSSKKTYIILLVVILMVILSITFIKMPTNITLIGSGLVASIIAMVFGVSWDKIQYNIIESLKPMLIPIVLLILIGMLTASWMISGTIPYMISLGLKYQIPQAHLVITCLICSAMSVTAGTSWGTISTVGVAMMGVSLGMGIPLEYTAGAVVVGSIFGDKLSPLSDTTVLASAVSEVKITDHMKQMLYTTLPGYFLSIVLFLILGNRIKTSSSTFEDISIIVTSINNTYNMNPLIILPPIITFALILMKKPIIPIFATAIVVALLLAIVFQGTTLTDAASALNGGCTINTENELVNSMIQRGGIKSMLGTVSLLIGASILAAPLRASGVIDNLVKDVATHCESQKSLLIGTFIIHALMFIIVGSYYVTFTVLGPVFKPLYDKYGLDGTNLSRTLEVTGTGLAAIIPWSITGAFIAGTLGVGNLEFIYFCPMIWVAIILSIVYFMTGKAIKKSK